MKASFRDFVDQADPRPTTSALRISPPFGSDEAKYFVLGMEAGLFRIDANGRIDSLLIAADGGSSGIAELFENNRGLVRTTVCRFSTAAALVLERGWLPQQIQVGARATEKEVMPHQLDITVNVSDGSLVAAIDIRRTLPELEKLRRDLQQCGRRGKHADDNCGFPQNHGRFEYCAFYQPPYFWAVAPESEMCFKMSYGDDGTIQMSDVSSLPPRSILEMSRSF
ncbi:MAG: hypothetical protein ACJ8M1_10145 [Chthoniobacterales bacterium]